MDPQSAAELKEKESSFAIKPRLIPGAGGGGGRSTQQSFIQGDSVRMSDPLPFNIISLTKKYSFRIPWYLLLTIGTLPFLNAVDALSFNYDY